MEMLIKKVNAFQIFIIMTEAAIKLQRQRSVHAKLILVKSVNFSKPRASFISFY